MPEQDPPVGRDPGGAHGKGYSAERPDTAPAPKADPVPVADAPPGAHVTHPEYDGPLPPVGRVAPPDGSDDDRIGTRL